MGAWAIGVFDNDDALDWVYELEESNDTELLQRSFDAVNTSAYRESPDCSAALAAAEVVAALAGVGSTELPEEVAAWVKKHSGSIRVNPKLRASAWTAVDHVLVESELQELWSDTDQFDEWQAMLRDLMSRLSTDA